MRINENSVVFIDRDGTVNQNYEDGPVYTVEKFKLIHSAAVGIRVLNSLGLKVFIITNQGGIRHRDRDFDKSTYKRIEKRMYALLKDEADAIIDDVFVCPHADYEECSCRKPKTGLFKQAWQKYKFDPESSFMIGDSSVDIIAGKKFGLITILVESGWQKDVSLSLTQKGYVPDIVASNLLEAARYIYSHCNGLYRKIL